MKALSINTNREELKLLHQDESPSFNERLSTTIIPTIRVISVVASAILAPVAYLQCAAGNPSLPVILGASARILPGAVSTKIRAIACGFRKSAYLCSAFHFETGDSVAASPKPSAFFMAVGVAYNIGSVPCGALMRPLPVSGGMQRGAEPFLFLSPRQVSYSFI